MGYLNSTTYETQGTGGLFMMGEIVMPRVRNCPRCQRLSLVPTGGYWGCGTCHYAITNAALCLELAARPVTESLAPDAPAEPAMSSR